MRKVVEQPAMSERQESQGVLRDTRPGSAAATSVPTCSKRSPAGSKVTGAARELYSIADEGDGFARREPARWRRWYARKFGVRLHCGAV